LSGIKFWDGLEQELSVWVEGTAEKILSQSHFHNLSHIHHSNSITDVFDDSEIMGDEEIGKTQLISKIHQEIQDLGLDRNIQGRNRFIRDDQIGTKRNSSGDTDPLTLSSTELMGVTEGILGMESNLLKKF
jgi:hypothetical protein